MIIDVPNAGDLPTTTSRLVHALGGITVTLEAYGELSATEAPLDVMIIAVEGEATVLAHPFDGQDVDYRTVHKIPLDLIGKVTVH